MRVSIIGQAAFGEAVFTRLREDGHHVVGVSAPSPVGDRADALWSAAAAAGLEPISTVSLKDTGSHAAWAALDAELCVMAFVTELLPVELFSMPGRGTIQYHPSILPLHRGSSAMAWPIINGETETGLTVFWPDEGMDTGPILLQKSVAMGPEETVGSLYFDKLFPLGVSALSEAVALIASGNAPHLPQDHAQATYEPPLADPHGSLAWHEPAARIHARIRGCNPQPGAWTNYKGARLRIFDCELSHEQQPGMPGRVIRVATDSFDVRLNGGVLRVKRVLPEGGKKINAGEWAASAGLQEGFRFRS